DLKPRTRESIFPYFTFFLPQRQQIIGYPIAGLDNDLRFGHRRYNFIWYRVGDAQQLREMCVDENGHQHEYSVPPPLIRKDLIARMRADAEAVMPPQFLDCLNQMRPFFTPIYDFSTPQLVFGRVALVGDAASSARPHMGFGMAKAGDDTQALAEALGSHDDIDAGLAAYNRIRQPIGERIMLHGRKLGTHLGVNLRTHEDRAMWKLLQNDRAMMDWIAVPNFLAAYRCPPCRNPITRATCASSATPTRAAGPTACRSWCIAATPISATCSPRVSAWSMYATPSARAR